MQVKAWGTRGSIAISNPESKNAGGNTTCYEVMSECLPKGVHLMLDAGTGFVPAGWSYLSELGKGLQYVTLFTHYHYDHIMGLTLAPPTFIDIVPMTLYGPVDLGVGPKEMVDRLFWRPFFPVDAKRVSHKMNFKPLRDFDVSVMVVHPEGGFALFSRDRYVQIMNGKKKQLPINEKSYSPGECMIITMQPANHGNSTCISYRFHEVRTNKVFVFCTDHEDEVGSKVDFRNHLAGADLLIMDAQYDRKTYMSKTAGFGHGTPQGVVKHGLISGVKSLGITHHDPRSTDAFLDGHILTEARNVVGRLASSQEFLEDFNPSEILLTDQDVFLCYDYQVYEV